MISSTVRVPVAVVLLFAGVVVGVLTYRSQQEIAEAAKAWGQNDDITVVTVRRMIA